MGGLESRNGTSPQSEAFGWQGHGKLRAHASYPGRSASAYSSREFFPPPILHTLCPDFDNQITVSKATELMALIAKRNNRLKSERQEKSKLELAMRLSSASSSSSGYESVFHGDAQRGCIEQGTLKGIGRRGRFTWRPVQQSLDSGTELDDETSCLAIRGKRACLEKQATAVVIPAVGATPKGEVCPQPNKSDVKARHRKTFNKSLKKFRARTLSSPLPLIRRPKHGEKPAAPVFGTSCLDREWEIVTVQEMCRRLSLDRLDQMAMPIPDGATSSQILDEAMIRQIMEILPARAEGYPWVNIYNSEKNGFSLFTFYRKMMEWEEEMSPVLLIIRDCEEHVFGAIASTALRPSEHFFGTGDSCLLFKFVVNPRTNERELHSFAWTGDNQYFVKASKDSLSMGAGGGHYGLWLDADLNHGRSLRCDTFDNEPLAGDSEDFNVQFLEAFGFCMQ
ncbi:TLD domain-containing protein 2 [Toxocara canis]|uniref:Oxidation resistance protein 1 n=1 Tax=Toxocara canis TaxID=6265 RepID=A0A0B2VQF5_TOXCA|nr:TLD domain-containing protein 2 [Toxocara canis]